MKTVSLFITIKYTGTTKIKNLALISNVAVVVVCCLLVKPARLDKHRGPSSAGVERVLTGVERVLTGVERVLAGVERVFKTAFFTKTCVTQFFLSGASSWN